MCVAFCFSDPTREVCAICACVCVCKVCSLCYSDSEPKKSAADADLERLKSQSVPPDDSEEPPLDSPAAGDGQGASVGLDGQPSAGETESVGLDGQPPPVESPSTVEGEPASAVGAQPPVDSLSQSDVPDAVRDAPDPREAEILPKPPNPAPRIRLFPDAQSAEEYAQQQVRVCVSVCACLWCFVPVFFCWCERCWVSLCEFVSVCALCVCMRS